MPRSVASFGPCRGTRVPFQSSSPLVGSQIPAMVLIRVDLPAPLSPTRAVTLPMGMSRSMSERAFTGPKLLPTPRSRSSGASEESMVELAESRAGARPAVAGRAPSSAPGVVTARILRVPCAHYYPEIPAAVQAALYLAVHSWAAGTKLSAMTVLFIFDGVTHSGVKSTDATATLAFVSMVLPLTSAAGGALPAR